MFSRQQRECQQLPDETMRACLFTFFAAIDPVLFSGKFLDDSSLEMHITICITMAHTDTLIAAPDLHINEEMAPNFCRKFTGTSCLRQKIANLNAALGFGRNDQHEAAMSKSRNDTSVSRDVHLSISASWFVGELECRRFGCRRVVQLPTLGPQPHGMGVADPLETCFTPPLLPCEIRSL